MAAFDHSTTYTDGKLKNWGHRRRLREIISAVSRLSLPVGAAYADVGCSNGFVTARVAKTIGAETVIGYDHLRDHLQRAQAQYPSYAFRELDLNHALNVEERYDFVTCFETLEHVGNIQVAIQNVLGLIAPGGVAFISVPVEIGVVGLGKFLAKSLLGYSIQELGVSYPRYIASLVTGERISIHRPKGLVGFGTHYGFDHRDVEDELTRAGVSVRGWTSGTTRFFLVGNEEYHLGATARH